MTASPFFGRMSARFSRGYGRAAILLGILSVLTFSKVWQETFDQYGITIWQVIVIIGLVFVLMCFAVGYAEERARVWGAETLHIWKMAGWDPNDIVEQLKAIRQHLDMEEEKSE